MVAILLLDTYQPSYRHLLLLEQSITLVLEGLSILRDGLCPSEAPESEIYRVQVYDLGGRDTVFQLVYKILC